MKISFVLALSAIPLLMLSFPVLAGIVDVQVSGAVYTDSKVSGIEEKGNVVVLNVGMHNTGSIGYAARARMDLMAGDSIIFTGWSEEKYLNPGERGGFVAYGYKQNATNLTMRARAYYGNEIAELEPSGLAPFVNSGAKSAFTISSFRTYDTYLRFDISSNQTLENVLVFPSGFPGTMMFEQRKLDGIGKGSVKEVKIPYDMGSFQKRKINITVATEDGQYFQSMEFDMERESGIMEYVHLLVDWLGGVFRS